MLDSAFKVAVIIDLMDRFSGPMKNVEKSVKSIDDAREVFRKVGAGMFAAGAGILAMGGSFVSAAAEVETYKTTLEVMLGSAEKANERFEELSEFSSRTPFNLPEVIQLGNSLQTIGRYSKENMTMLGDLAAATNKPIEQVTNAFAKLASGQKGEAQRMFQDLLISTQDWVKYTGKGVSKSGELLATTEEMIAALPKILEARGFVGMMDKQSKTFKGAMSNLSDALFRFRMYFGEGLLDPLKELAKGLTKIIDGINAWAKANPEAAKTIARIVGILGILLVFLGAVAFSVGILIPALKNLALAFKIVSDAINFLFTSNPVGIIIAIVAAVITLGVILFKTFKPFRVFIVNLVNNIAGGIGYIVGTFEGLFGRLSDFLKSKLGKIVMVGVAIFMPFVSIPFLIIKNFKKIVGFFSSFWNLITSGINVFKEKFVSLWNTIKEAPKGFLNFIIDGFNKLIDGINSIKIEFPKWVPQIGGKVFSLNIPKIPSFAVGVENFSGGLAYVHRDELVSLPKGSNVFTKRETREMLTGRNTNIYKIFNIERVEVNADDIHRAIDFINMLELEMEVK